MPVTNMSIGTLGCVLLSLSAVSSKKIPRMIPRELCTTTENTLIPSLAVVCLHHGWPLDTTELNRVRYSLTFHSLFFPVSCNWLIGKSNVKWNADLCQSKEAPCIDESMDPSLHHQGATLDIDFSTHSFPWQLQTRTSCPLFTIRNKYHFTHRDWFHCRNQKGFRFECRWQLWPISLFVCLSSMVIAGCHQRTVITW